MEAFYDGRKKKFFITDEIMKYSITDGIINYFMKYVVTDGIKLYLYMADS